MWGQPGHPAGSPRGSLSQPSYGGAGRDSPSTRSTAGGQQQQQDNQQHSPQRGFWSLGNSLLESVWGPRTPAAPAVPPAASNPPSRRVTTYLSIEPNTAAAYAAAAIAEHEAEQAAAGGRAVPFPSAASLHDDAGDGLGPLPRGALLRNESFASEASYISSCSAQAGALSSAGSDGSYYTPESGNSSEQLATAPKAKRSQLSVIRRWVWNPKAAAAGLSDGGARPRSGGGGGAAAAAAAAAVGAAGAVGAASAAAAAAGSSRSVSPGPASPGAASLGADSRGAASSGARSPPPRSPGAASAGSGAATPRTGASDQYGLRRADVAAPASLRQLHVSSTGGTPMAGDAEVGHAARRVSRTSRASSASGVSSTMIPGVSYTQIRTGRESLRSRPGDLDDADFFEEKLAKPSPKKAGSAKYATSSQGEVASVSAMGAGADVDSDKGSSAGRCTHWYHTNKWARPTLILIALFLMCCIIGTAVALRMTVGKQRERAAQRALALQNRRPPPVIPKPSDQMVFTVNLAVPPGGEGKPPPTCADLFYGGKSGNSEPVATRARQYIDQFSQAYAAALNLPPTEVTVTRVLCDGKVVDVPVLAAPTEVDIEGLKVAAAPPTRRRQLLQSGPGPATADVGGGASLATGFTVPAPAEPMKQALLVDSVTRHSDQILQAPLSKLFGAPVVVKKVQFHPNAGAPPLPPVAQAPAPPPVPAPAPAPAAEEPRQPVEVVPNPSAAPEEEPAAPPPPPPPEPSSMMDEVPATIVIIEPTQKSTTGGGNDGKGKPAAARNGTAAAKPAAAGNATAAAKPAAAGNATAAAKPAAAGNATRPKLAEPVDLAVLVTPPRAQVKSLPPAPRLMALPPAVKWDAAPTCQFSVTSKNSVSDADGRLWGWQNDQSCAFRVHDGRADLQGKAIRLIWSTAPVCTQAPTLSNSVPDTQGRLWGWLNGKSCAFRSYKPNTQTITVNTSNGPEQQDFELPMKRKQA